MSYLALNAGINAVTLDNFATSDAPGSQRFNFPAGIAPNRGDADITLVPGVDFETQYFRSPLTANRLVTLSTKNVRNGSRFRVVREGLGAGTLDVGGLKTIPAATRAFVEIQYTIDPLIGAFWVLIGYGLL
jgi:hypothetical protein